MAKRTVLMSILLAGLLVLTGLTADLPAQEKKFIKKGDAFPEIALQAPVQAKDRTYLGISGDRFSIKDLKGEVFLVEVFDVYCIPCQKQAPLYRELFGKLQADPSTREKVKMMGIAVGNDNDEVKKFTDHFKVPYPIALDPDYKFHKAIGGPPAPFNMIVHREPGKKAAVVVGTHLGLNEDMKGLLQQLQSLVRPGQSAPAGQAK